MNGELFEEVVLASAAGFKLTGMTAYMFDAKLPLFTRGLSFFHFWLPFVLAWLVCRVVARIPAADHRIVVAEVVVGDPSGAGRPLLYHQGRYNVLRD